MSETKIEEGEFLQKFGYRSFDGERKGRMMRILDIINFEVRTTWHRSTFGKILLIITLVVNAITIFIASLISPALDQTSDSIVRNGMNQLAANYLLITESPVRSSVDQLSFSISIQLGFLLIALFAIAGSGFFADDKEGRVVEIYLSRIDKSEYITGKIGAIVIYTNLFVMVPLLVTSILTAQSYKVDHLDYLGFYAGLIVYTFIASLILGLGILSLSIAVDKRHYASLGYFIIFFLGSVFGTQIFYLDSSNELLLLISPEVFITLLAYVCLGDFDLGYRTSEFDFFNFQGLHLNDGAGLEYWHVLLVALGYIVILSTFLAYKIRKLTTEEL